MRANHYNQHVAIKLEVYLREMHRLGCKNCIILSGEQRYPFRDDLAFPFVANLYFKEWLDLADRQGSIIHVSNSAKKPILYLLETSDYWHSEPSNVSDDIQLNFEVCGYASREVLLAKLAQLPDCVCIGEDPDLSIRNAMHINPDALLNRLNFCRADKTEYEHQCLRDATAKAVIGHRSAEKGFRDGKSEYEIHMDYLSAVKCLDSEQPYNNIIGINENAATLHHWQLSKSRRAKNLSLLIDAGASGAGYASDITRTYSSSSTGSFADLIVGVDDLQQKLVAKIEVGLPYGHLHELCHEMVFDLLLDLGVAKHSVDKEQKLNVSKCFFPHGLGHLLGVQVHDQGGNLDEKTSLPLPANIDHPALRLSRTITPNMVFTVEPGVYFIPSLLSKLKETSFENINWSLVEELMPYGGVRIEDNIIVHGDSIENVTRDHFAASS